MQLFIDNWSATLLAPATASAVSLSVEPANAALLTGLGSGAFYRLTLVEVDASGAEIDWDVVQVTAVAAGVLTVTRTGTARSWAYGALIEARLTAAGMGELRDAGGGVAPGDLADVAFSGDYADLAGKPAIPSTAADVGAIPTSQKGAASGVATLDADGKVPLAQVPATAITNTSVVNTEAAMLALVAQVGDVAIRPDISSSFILQAEPASTLVNWQQILTPATGGGASVGSSTPQALGSATPGVSGNASREDHVHPAPTPGDIGAATAAQGAKADSAIQPPALASALSGKVDKVTGYDLSQENFTPAEKAKLAALDEAHYKGTYVNLAALEAAHPTASAGNYADVDAGAGDPVLRYIWDVSDSEWAAQAGSADPVTAAQVKTLYESNADTNAFTDAEKSKLAGVTAGATANADTDSLAEGATNLYHTAARVRAVVLTGLSLADSAVVAATDTVLQAIGKLAARLALAFDRANHTGSQATSTVTGLDAALAARALIAGLPSRDVTASGAVTPTDAGKWLICNSASPITLTIGAEATAAWTAAGILPMFHILQIGAGAVTVTGDGFSVTLHADDTNVLDGAGAAATALWRASNTWSLIGRLVAA